MNPKLLPTLAFSALLCSQAHAAPMGADGSLCPELLQAADQAAVAHRVMARDVADQIAAGPPLEEQTCLGKLRELDFSSFFDGIPSFSGLSIKALQDRALEEMMNMACEAGSQAIESANTLLTCSAAVGVRFSANAGLDDLDVQECGGLDLDRTIDGGDHSVGGGDNTVGGDYRNTTRSTTRGTPSSDDDSDLLRRGWDAWRSQ